VVTGGGTGIGFGAAKRFVDEGAFVYIFGRRQEQLDAAVAKLGSSARAVRGSVTDLADLDRLYEKVKEMPTHEARRALKRNEVMKMDLERSGYEAELEAQILEDVARLKDFQLSR
jgi:NAD(P)-dependent dehydrogenase (short-subunit alcohol dehydrogenase family)